MAKAEGQYEVNIVWPDDVHSAAEIANFFTFTDDGQGLYLAFGHVAPRSAIPEGSGVVDVNPLVRSSVYLSHHNARQLAGLLAQYVEHKDQGSSGSAE